VNIRPFAGRVSTMPRLLICGAGCSHRRQIKEETPIATKHECLTTTRLDPSGSPHPRQRVTGAARRVRHSSTSLRENRTTTRSSCSIRGRQDAPGLSPVFRRQLVSGAALRFTGRTPIRLRTLSRLPITTTFYSEVPTNRRPYHERAATLADYVHMRPHQLLRNRRGTLLTSA